MFRLSKHHFAICSEQTGKFGGGLQAKSSGGPNFPELWATFETSKG